MTTDVFRSILSFAKGIVGGWTHDAGARLFGMLIVTVNVIYVHEYRGSA